MNGEARQLRELAGRIERVTKESMVCSIAWDQVSALRDHLCLRARVMGLEGEKLSEEPYQDYGD